MAIFKHDALGLYTPAVYFMSAHEKRLIHSKFLNAYSLTRRILQFVEMPVQLRAYSGERRGNDGRYLGNRNSNVGPYSSSRVLLQVRYPSALTISTSLAHSLGIVSVNSSSRVRCNKYHMYL